MTTEAGADPRASIRRRARWGARPLLTSLALASLLVAVACGSAPRSSPKPTATPTVSRTPPDTVTASPTPDASSAAVLTAYQAYFAAVDEALAATSSPGAWNTPALSATMVNPLLQQWQNELIQQQAQGIMVEGSLTPEHPKVVSNTGATATVSDCVWDVAVQYYRAPNGGTPEAVPNQPGGTQPEGDGYRVTFSLLSGKWMASSEPSAEAGNCTGF